MKSMQLMIDEMLWRTSHLNFWFTKSDYRIQQFCTNLWLSEVPINLDSTVFQLLQGNLLLSYSWFNYKRLQTF